jgi:hypothetical protein
MNKTIWKRSEIDSPCVNICIIHPQAKICAGCNRTMEEISNWSKKSTLERKEIMKELPNRSSLLKVRRGGRTNRLGS